MSHVDEGALHAYLDGALNEYPRDDAERIRSHLEGCDACAERLEVERRIRADAQAMLGLAAPRVDVPDFEELRAYVDRTRAPRVRGVSRIQRLGWVASVVVALGIGWMLREVQLPDSPLDAPAARVPVPAAEAVSESDADLAIDVPRTADAGRSVARAPDAASPAPDAVSAFAVLDSTSGEEAGPEESAAVRQASLVSPETARVAAAHRTAGPAVGGDASSPGRLAPDVDSAREGWPSGGQETEGPPQTQSPESVRARTLEAPAMVSDRQAAGAPAVDSSPAAESFPGAFPRAIPGYEVVSITNLSSGEDAVGVSVVQRLPDGRMIDVIHLEANVDPSILPDEEDARNEIRVETSQGWILLRGPLAPEELGALLRQILPEGP